GIISNLGYIIKTTVMVLGSVLSVLTPLIIALVITYLLHPLVSWIEAFILKNIKLLAPKANKNDKYRQLRRTFSVLITYLLFIALIVFFITSLYGLIIGSLPKHIDLYSMLASITDYSNTANQLFSKLTVSMENSGFSDDVKKQLLQLIQVSKTVAANAIAGLFTSLQGIGNNLINITLGFIIALYILIDMEYFKDLYHQCTTLLFKSQHYEKIAGYMADVNGVISSFIRGQLLAALIVGILSSIALYIVGLDFAVFVGMTSGLFNIIPYFGPLIGSVLAVVVGLLSGSLNKAVLAVIALVIVQQIDSNIISPKIVGDSVGLHPVFIMLAIIIGGSIFGIWGMLIAVPVAGIIKLILNRWMVFKTQNQE
ncbi:MAG: AI-2E family transporter, partial [Oscillospiraceae bacterium]